MKCFYTLLFYLPHFSIMAQDISLPAIEISSFEYIWEKDVQAAAQQLPQRIILMTENSNQESLKKSFTKAIADKWNVGVPDFNVSVKNLPVLANKPKFKIKLKQKDPRRMYMFVQIFDKCNYYHSPDDVSRSATLDIRYKLINGMNDSAMDRNLSVTVLKSPAPEGELPLTRLPGLPSSFMHAFDSIAAWILDEKVTGNKEILIRPACAYTDPSSLQPILDQFFFQIEGRSIKLPSENGFTLQHHGATTERTGKKKNVGGNAAGGVFTILTGVRTYKTKTFSYTDDHLFTSGIHTYHSFVSYNEEEVAEREREKNDDGSYSNRSTDYTSANRYMDTSSPNVVTLGKDTVVSFRMKFNYSMGDYTRMWDGRDTTTISILPSGWLNGKQKESSLSGEFQKQPFTMTTTNGGLVKKFVINGHPAATFYGNPKPRKATLFNRQTENELIMFTILSVISDHYRFSTGSIN